MLLGRVAAVAILLAGLACAPERVVVTDDEVPLTAPLEADDGLPGEAPGQVQEDPPGRPIRLSFAAGSVSRQPSGLDEWAEAGVNQPLGPGDNLWVAPGGKAELHAGPTGLRLASGTGLEILHLDDRSLQVGLPRGSVELRILPGRDGDSLEIDTPDSAVLLDHPGEYRVDVDPDAGFDRVTVRQGQAEVTAGGVTLPVDPGSCLELTAGAAPRYDVLAALAPDSFDQWCTGRDQREDRCESSLYLGRDVTGFEDLDGHGSWQVHATYGTAWVPAVPADWAPYRDGRWVWAEPWGWTWVDAAPWGYAPSHYGRWVHAGRTWMWLPHADGMRMARAVYAPALVVFVGGPGARGGGAAAGGVAWFPLGPREPYHPAYRASRAYVQALNAPNLPPGAVASAQGFANRAVPGAVTVVPRSVFTGALPVGAARIPLGGPRQALEGRVGSAPALVPQRESLLSGRPGPPASRPPAADALRPLLVRRMPLAPVPFEQRQQALAAGQGRPLPVQVLERLRNQGAPPRGIPARLATAAGSGRPAPPSRPLLAPGQPAVARPFLPPPAVQPRVLLPAPDRGPGGGGAARGPVQGPVRVLGPGAFPGSGPQRTQVPEVRPPAAPARKLPRIQPRVQPGTQPRRAGPSLPGPRSGAPRGGVAVPPRKRIYP